MIVGEQFRLTAHRKRREPKRRDVEHTVLRQIVQPTERPAGLVRGILRDLVVSTKGPAEEWAEVVVIRGLQCVTAHARVWVLDAAREASE